MLRHRRPPIPTNARPTNNISLCTLTRLARTSVASPPSPFLQPLYTLCGIHTLTRGWPAGAATALAQNLGRSARGRQPVARPAMPMRCTLARCALAQSCWPVGPRYVALTRLSSIWLRKYLPVGCTSSRLWSRTYLPAPAAAAAQPAAASVQAAGSGARRAGEPSAAAPRHGSASGAQARPPGSSPAAAGHATSVAHPAAPGRPQLQQAGPAAGPPQQHRQQPTLDQLVLEHQAGDDVALAVDLDLLPVVGQRRQRVATPWAAPRSPPGRDRWVGGQGRWVGGAGGWLDGWVAGWVG
jgi:hypothetical protein